MSAVGSHFYDVWDMWWVVLGWYEYDLPRDALPLVTRTCVVMQTVGNKRVGDHVLTGLERSAPPFLLFYA
jgi:hypothetical protein